MIWRKKIIAGMGALLSSVVFILPLLAFLLLTWHPDPYGEFTGGKDIAGIIFCIDLVVGPLLVMVVFDNKKSRSQIIDDFLVVMIIRLATLIYGASVLAATRPVAFVFAYDRMTLVSADAVRMQELPFAEHGRRNLSWHGPRILSLRDSKPEEKLTSVDLALQGYDLPQRPSYWREFDRMLALERAYPIGMLQDDAHAELKVVCASNPLVCRESVRILPFDGVQRNGVVVFDEDGLVIDLLSYASNP